jgi:hypothetical protein
MTATIYDQEKVIPVLLDGGARINKQGAAGYAALHFACYYGLVCIARVLVERGAFIDLTDKDGCTPSEVATERGKMKIAAYFTQLSRYEVSRESLLKVALKRLRAAIVSAAELFVVVLVFEAIHIVSILLVSKILPCSLFSSKGDFEMWDHWLGCDVPRQEDGA